MAQPSGQPNFDLGALFQKSWEVFQRNALALVVGVIVIVVIVGVAGAIAGVIAGRLSGIGIALVQGPLALGYCGIALSAARGGSPQLASLFDGFKRYLPAFLASLAMSAPSLIASIAGSSLISIVMIPVSIIFAFLFGLTYYFMSDRKLDFWPSMQSSLETVTKAVGPWLVLYIVLFVMNFIAALPCGLGLPITIPLSSVILALAYDQVVGSGSAFSAAPEAGDYQA